MKRTSRCVKCGGTQVFHAPEVMDRGEGNVALPLSIKRSGALLGRDLGQIEAYVCLACGYAEFYVLAPSELAEKQEDGITEDAPAAALRRAPEGSRTRRRRRARDAEAGA
ncbi:MAG: hypothetical protein HYZ53_15275 [Planctomycetes bacterium]|nr:hypothetical protein [Planctomycetota bacterium]